VPTTWITNVPCAVGCRVPPKTLLPVWEQRQYDNSVQCLSVVQLRRAEGHPKEGEKDDDDTQDRNT
jgi:hypothetical protein